MRHWFRNPDGSSRGVGFCRMTTAESCCSIIAEFHGRRLGDGLQPLIVKLADSSSRKSKRSTPSLRSFYSSDSHGNGGYGYGTKGKLATATPLMTTPLIDPVNFLSHHLNFVWIFKLIKRIISSWPITACKMLRWLSTQQPCWPMAVVDIHQLLQARANTLPKLMAKFQVF